MLALKRMMILGIVVFLIVWTVLLNIGQVVGDASEANATLPPTLVSPANDAWVTENKPTFTWIFIDPDLNDSQSGFNLQISDDMNFSTPVQNITAKSSTQNYTLTTALSDGMYYWKVKTNDTNGAWSDWSSPWLVKIDTTPPDPVTEVSFRLLTKFEIRGLEAGGQLIDITWTASDDPYFQQYEIYLLKAPPPIPPDVPPNATIPYAYSTKYTTEIGPIGLDSDTTYYVCVVVVDQAGLKSEADYVTITTTAPLNWPLIGGVALAIEAAIGAIIVVVKLFMKKE